MSADDLQNDTANENKEEEDPLDAYMKSLDASTNTAAANNNKAGRLDLDNEDEATSHWKTSDETKKKGANDDEDNGGEVDEDGFVKRSAVAKRALHQTFHKAGAKKGGDDSGDDNNDKIRSKQVDIQLEQVNHQQMNYEPFEKVFWKPPTPTLDSSNNNQHFSWRQQHGITLQPPQYQNQFAPIYDFLELKGEVMEDVLLDHIRKSGYHHPTPVQAQTLPIALGGHDALITAPTGSGKTLAYVWPMIVHVCAQHHLQANETGPIGLILVPTRELAQQVQKHVQSMIQPMQGTSLTIIGGMGKYPLVQHLKQKGGVEIVVATPGRLLDVLATKQQQQQQQNSSKNKTKGLSLERTTMVVLDECDRLLHMGFVSQITQILQNIRPDRQTLMLSATMSRRIETVAKQWLSGDGGNNESGIGHSATTTNDYVRIAVGRTGQASLHVQQHVMVVPHEAAKLAWLQQMLPILCGVGRTLVFSATKDGCEKLANQLVSHLGDDITCVTLHGDKHQSDRNAALRKFIKKQKVVLIATDVASRGLDIPQVTTVVNYDPPKNLDVHVHRVGRAGRLSTSKNGQEEQQPKEGAAYTLLRKPRDADIGHVLLGAFEREDRPVPEELRELAKLSRHRRGGDGSDAPSQQSRSRWNKSGLGSNEGSYAPASSSSQPPAQKKSRWS